MLISSKYIAPSVEFTRLQLEGVIADSCYPTLKNGSAQYYEYEVGTPATPLSQDIVIL
jgi:hypothetical protein